MSWAAPLALGWLALILLVFLLYLLRPARQRIQVASVLLWRRTLARRHERSWLQWPKRHLLLILQALVIAALALALARPEQSVSQTTQPPVSVVVDASLSMLIEDVAPNRLEAAKQRAVQFVRGLPRETPVSVIAAAGTVRPLTIGATDRFGIEGAIRSIRPSAAEGRLADALDTALSLAPAESGGSVALFSDGVTALEPRPDYARVRAFNVSGDARNVAIEQFAVRRRLDDPSMVEALVALRNQGAVPVSVPVSVESGGDRAQANVVLAAGAREVLVFTELPPAAGYEVGIAPPDDGLAADNRAFAELADARELTVLVVAEEPSLITRALAALPGVRVSGITPAQAQRADPHDIYVYVAAVPDPLPNGSIVLVRPGGNEELGIEAPETAASVPRPVAESPLAARLDALSLAAGDNLAYSLPGWARPDLSVGERAVLAHGTHAGRRLVLVGLDVQAPGVALAPWYPVFWSDVVRWADPFDPRPEGAPLRPDQAVVLVPHPLAERVEIVSPDGERTSRTAAQSMAFTPHELGVYVVRQFRGEALLAQARLPVDAPGLPSARALAQAFGPPAAPARAEPLRVDRIEERWPWFAAVALVLLAAEWWWFHRVRGLR